MSGCRSMLIVVVQPDQKIIHATRSACHQRGREHPQMYPDRLVLKAIVIMIVRHLHNVHELLSVLAQTTAETTIMPPAETTRGVALLIGCSRMTLQIARQRPRGKDRGCSRLTAYLAKPGCPVGPPLNQVNRLRQAPNRPRVCGPPVAVHLCPAGPAGPIPELLVHDVADSQSVHIQLVRAPRRGLR